MKSKAVGKENNKYSPDRLRKLVRMSSFDSLVEKNNQNVDHVKAQSLVPSFDPLIENTPKDEVRCIQPRPYLPTDYNTAKLQYKATKARASTRESIDIARVASVSTTSSIMTVNKPAGAPPTVDSGLKALGLIRPLDSKTFEFGLAKGIQLHLVENIKLCGLKKAREKSLLDVVSTLCNHLANRELDIERWVEFADEIALTSAEKFDQIMHEHQTICCSKDDAVKAAHMAMMIINKEVLNVKKEICKLREEVMDILTTFPSVFCDIEKLRHQVQFHCSSVRTACKSEAFRAVDELTTSHNIEMRRLENVIDRLEMSIQVEGEKVKSLQCQLIDTAALLKNEQKEHSAALAKMKVDEGKYRDDLQRANDQIKSLEMLAETERKHKAKELHDKDEKMKAELDAIDEKVKHSIKVLVESKNKAIEEARKLKAQLECLSKNNQK